MIFKNYLNLIPSIEMVNDEYQFLKKIEKLMTKGKQLLSGVSAYYA